MKLLILLSAVLLVASAAAAQPNDEKAVRAAVEALNQAARSGDAAALGRMLSEDLIYVHSNARKENKAECIAALVRDKVNFELKPGWTVRLYGNTAVVHAQTVARLMQEGKPAEIPLDMLQVWVRDGRQWKLVARHTARLP